MSRLKGSKNKVNKLSKLNVKEILIAQNTEIIDQLKILNVSVLNGRRVFINKLIIETVPFMLLLFAVISYTFNKNFNAGIFIFGAICLFIAIKLFSTRSEEMYKEIIGDITKWTLQNWMSFAYSKVGI